MSSTTQTEKHTNKLSPSETTSTTNSPNDVEAGRYGPLAHINTAESRVPAFGGEFQPGLYRSPKARKFANPAPLGLCGFALTTFILGCVQMNVRGISKPNMIVGPALAYGGLVQLLAGMWYVFHLSLFFFFPLPGCCLVVDMVTLVEDPALTGYDREMAVGNTFGATVLSSYGGFWISLAVTLIPGGFQIEQGLLAADKGSPIMFYNSFALYLMVSCQPCPYPLPATHPQKEKERSPLTEPRSRRAGSSSRSSSCSAPSSRPWRSSVYSSLSTWPSCSSPWRISILMRRCCRIRG